MMHEELTTNLKNILIAAVLANLRGRADVDLRLELEVEPVGDGPRDVRTVLVAARDIPVGTTGTQLAHAGWLTARRVPSDGLLGHRPEQGGLATLVAIQPTYHGEQIVAQRFGTSQQEGSCRPSTASCGSSAAGRPNQLLVGIVKQGNRVDVVGSVTRPEGSQTHYGVIAVRNLLVVKAPSALVHERRLAFGRPAAHVGSGPEAVLAREERRLVVAPASVGAPVERGQRPGDAHDGRRGLECSLTTSKVAVVGGAAAAALEAELAGIDSFELLPAGARSADCRPT